MSIHEPSPAFHIVAVIIICVIVATGIGGCLVGKPHYDVWHQKMVGEAELARAQQNRQIRVSEAQAELEASRMKAQSEVERAKGVAEANKIIGTSLEGNEAYLRYLWIDRLTNAQNDVIYIPTEAGMPILESSRLSQRNHFHIAATPTQSTTSDIDRKPEGSQAHGD